MRTITVNIDESVYQKFMTLVELFPKNKLKITSDDKQKDKRGQATFPHTLS